MRKNFFFRLWFYFRQGWSTYFAFIFAGINTLTVTYYLAIERYPTLLGIFPTFFQYIIIVVSIGIPLLVAIGYSHYKKTPSYRAEADVYIESDPYHARVLINSEILVRMNLKLTLFILKLSKNEKLSEDETKELTDLLKEISDLTENRSFSNKRDIEHFRKYS